MTARTSSLTGDFGSSGQLHPVSPTGHPAGGASAAKRQQAGSGSVGCSLFPGSSGTPGSRSGDPNLTGPGRDRPDRLTPDPRMASLRGNIPIRDPVAVVPAMAPPDAPPRAGEGSVSRSASEHPSCGRPCLAYAMSHPGCTAAHSRGSGVSVPDLRVEIPVFCHAQDLLIRYDDEAKLVPRDELWP